MAKRAAPVVFLTFAEAHPEAKLLNDPNTPAAQKDAIRKDIARSVGVVRNVARRNTQGGRHEDNHDRRSAVMRDYVPGKRGQAKALAKAHGVPARTVERWIADVRKPPRPVPVVIAETWHAVAEGKLLRYQGLMDSRRGKKSKT